MRVIVTGATGMIGEGVLIECLESGEVEKVLSVGRRELERSHPKLEQYIHEDFTDFGPAVERFKAFGPDACFHCMGVSSVGMKEADFTRLTLDVTKSLADAVFAAGPGGAFIYVSGAGTDSSEQGSVMWARVKGRAENYVLQRGFGAAYAFRIGIVIPVKGVKSSTGWYNAMYVVMRPFYKLMQRLKSVTTSAQAGRAMIRLARTQAQSGVVESPRIKELGSGDV